MLELAGLPVVAHALRAFVAADGIETVDDGMQDPGRVLNTIRTDETRAVYVLRDLHRWFDPIVLRLLKTAAREIQAAPRSSARAIILLSPPGEIPPELSGATVIDWPIPTRPEMTAVLDAAMQQLPEEVAKLENGDREAAIDAAMGLTAEQAANCYAKSIVTSRSIDVLSVAGEKKRVIAREKVLNWTDPDPRGLDAVGGLDGLKDWLRTRRTAFSKEAREYGLPAPKGFLLVGVPGCGKSLTAKAVASAWGIPFLRLDLGALKSKWVGESEANIRKALSVAETVSPCVLWLDELEKSLGGATSGAADGGVSSDALGCVLQWMQDRTGSVFVVATANNVEQLPPELIRKGRFDEMFFIDLPNTEERRAVLAATLDQYKRDRNGIDLDALAETTETFSGAEIAALVPDAMFEAFGDGARPITTKDLLTAAQSVVPMAKTSKDRIDALRKWAKGRARLASISDTDATGTSGRRELDL